MTKHFLCFFLCFIHLCLFGQDIIIVKGQVLEKQSKKPFKEAHTVLFEVKEDGTLTKFQEKNCDSMGNYSYELEKNKNYKVVGNAEGYSTNEVSYCTYEEVFSPIKNIFLVQGGGCRLSPPINYLLGNIYFKPSSYFLSIENRYDLDNIVDSLKKTPHIVLLIEGHSDYQELRDSTCLLSDLRAREVYNYFYDKGIDPKRLSWIAYSDTQLDFEMEREATDRQLNARVGFRIISTKFISDEQYKLYPAPPVPLEPNNIFPRISIKQP